MSKKQTVIIIGAGPSGLYAAKYLQKTSREAKLNLEIFIVEALDRIGGRVLSYPLAERCPQSTTHVEFGPEFVHGEANNLFVDLLNLLHPDGSGLLELDYPNYFYFGKEGTFLPSSTAFKENEELAELFDVYDQLDELDAEKEEERSLLRYFTEKNVSSRFLDIADAIFANDYGTDLSHVGLKETIIEQQRWTYGEKYLVLTKNTFSDVIRELSKGIRVLFNWVVTQIDYSNPQYVKLRNSKGEEVIANKVIVTVPISVLQRGDINFSPPLNPDRLLAINSVKMANAIKIAVIVNRKFWPDDFYDAVCSDSFVPEIWLTPAAVAINPDNHLATFTIIGFITGDRANRVIAMDENEVKRLFLNQLDSIFGSPSNPNPASSSCIDFFIRDWSKEPHFYGAYTYPTLGALHLRPKISAPLSNSVFFCGEATHTGINPCVHGAFETAIRASSELMSSLQTSRL